MMHWLAGSSVLAGLLTLLVVLPWWGALPLAAGMVWLWRTC